MHHSETVGENAAVTRQKAHTRCRAPRQIRSVMKPAVAPSLDEPPLEAKCPKEPGVEGSNNRERLALELGGGIERVEEATSFRSSSGWSPLLVRTAPSVAGGARLRKLGTRNRLSRRSIRSSARAGLLPRPARDYASPLNMKIQAGVVVTVEYTVRDEAGQLLEEREGKTTLAYLHGHKNIAPGLEEALEGKTVGEQIEVTLPPEKGFGVRDPQLVFDMPFGELPKDVKPQRGMTLQVRTPASNVTGATVTRVKLKSVEVDANHRWAGRTLQFSLRVRSIRRATAVELEHHHVHAGGHHH
jgi:FKBP-type peptidyl-prolyl cis-trans isomerase SlyD